MLSSNAIGSTELAARIHAIAGEPPAAAQRRLREWVENNALPTTGPANTGRGRERGYDDMAALLAGIAAAMSRWRSPVPVIRMVLAALLAREVKSQAGVANSGRLRRIIAGDLDAMLVLQPGDTRRDSMTYFIVPRPEIGDFMASDAFAGVGNALVLDLPRLCRVVAATGFEPKAGAAIRDAVDGRAEIITAAAKGAARATREEVESRRLAIAEKELRARKARLDAKAAAARKARDVTSGK